MTPHRLLAPLFVAMLVATVALAACSSGDEDTSEHSGTLTDPRKVPTSTPWDNPPEVIILDPGQLKPLAPDATPAPTGGGTSGDCSPKYKIQSGDTLSAIAERCGITTQEMRDANPGVDPATLHIGDEVNIPGQEPESSPSQ